MRDLERFGLVIGVNRGFGLFPVYSLRLCAVTSEGDEEKEGKSQM